MSEEAMTDYLTPVPVSPTNRLAAYSAAHRQAPACMKSIELQIAEALRTKGLTLVKTATGYVVLKLGEVTAQQAPAAAAEPDAFRCLHEWDGLVRVSMPPKYACKHCHNFFDAPPSSAPQPAHPACKPDMLVNGGALKLALNALRRAGKDEVADELEKTTQPAPAQDYPPLPESIKYGQLDHSSGAYGYRPQDMRAYVDADRAARAPADSVLEDAARESEYQRGYRHGYEQRDAEVRGALA